MRFILKSAKKDTPKYTQRIQWQPKSAKKKWKRKQKATPSNRPQLINEIYYGHQSFTNKQFGPS